MTLLEFKNMVVKYCEEHPDEVDLTVVDNQPKFLNAIQKLSANTYGMPEFVILLYQK